MVAPLSFRLKAGLQYITPENRWNVLTALLLHANNRGRCYPTTEDLAPLATNGNLQKAVDAKHWLIDHRAIALVPYTLRVGKELFLPIRQHVYQLTGFFIADGRLFPYLYMGEEDWQEIIGYLREIETTTGAEIIPVENFSAEIFNGEKQSIVSIKDSHDSKDLAQRRKRRASKTPNSELDALPKSGKKGRAPKKERPRNEYFDALIEAFGYEPKAFTGTAASQFALVANELKAVEFPVDQIKALYEFVQEKATTQQWHGFSVSALSKYLPEFYAKPAPAPARYGVIGDDER